MKAALLISGLPVSISSLTPLGPFVSVVVCRVVAIWLLHRFVSVVSPEKKKVLSVISLTEFLTCRGQ